MASRVKVGCSHWESASFLFITLPWVWTPYYHNKLYFYRHVQTEAAFLGIRLNFMWPPVLCGNTVLSQFLDLPYIVPPPGATQWPCHPSYCMFKRTLIYFSNRLWQRTLIFSFWLLFVEKPVYSSCINISGRRKTLCSQVSIQPAKRYMSKTSLSGAFQNPCRDLCMRRWQIAQCNIERSN